MLPQSKGNLFQRIKALCAEQKSKGKKLIELTIGEPVIPAFIESRQAAAEAIMSDNPAVHGYQDNGEAGVPGFSQRFIQCHVATDLAPLIKAGSLATLPLPGIKPMFGVVINSLGAWLPDARTRMVATLTDPGYPTPAVQCGLAKNIIHRHLPTNPDNGFLFSVDDLVKMGLMEGDMILLNFPVNPTGVIMIRKWLRPILSFCQEMGIRVVNDAAYAIMTDRSVATTLTDTAIEFPELNWIEMFSASKAGNHCGWRVGAAIGSPEFIADMKCIKGDDDSGFNAPLAAGVLHLFEKHPERIAEVRGMYASRLDVLIRVMTAAGMRLAVQPEAGFFAIFHPPKRAFGVDVKDAEHFNSLMIENTDPGLVGVPFRGWIRYTVAPVDVVAEEDGIAKAINSAHVSY